MSYNSLNEFIEILDKSGELITINKYVNPELEITEIVDRISKTDNGGKALLFTNTGTQFPILINAMGSMNRMKLALGVKDFDDIGKEIKQIFNDITKPKTSFFDKLKMLPTLKQFSSWMPKVVSGRGVCQEIVMPDVDITKFPILKCWPHDGGQFITLPVVHTKDPNTNIRNVGMYRIQIFEKNLTGMHWHKHKTGARHYQEYKQLNKKMPVAITLGGDPVYTYSATAPLPDNIDEYMLAGFIRKKRVELVKCLTQEIEVPNDVDIVIEGYVDPNEKLIYEGPFGDHTGFYSLADYYPRFHITCITHRKNAVYPATIVGIPPQEDAYIAKATERIFLEPIKITMLPEMVDMDIPIAGVAHNLTIVKINKSFSGHAMKVMNALWGAGQMMFNKIMVVVSDDIDIHNYQEVAATVSANFDPTNDIIFSKGPLDVLDHSSTKFSFGGKMCIDATKKYDDELQSTNTNDHVKDFSDDDISTIKKTFPSVCNINSSLIAKNISLVIISVNKNNLSNEFKNKPIKKFAQKLLNSEVLMKIKFIVIMDAFVDIQDILTTSWICFNNIDPQRDVSIFENEQLTSSNIIVDGTQKTSKEDNFKRDWPNIVVSDDKTITKIDQIWNNLGIGTFIESPSLKFKNYIKTNNAVAL